MVGESIVSLIANGNGAQAYFNHELLGDTSCPLSQGQEVRAKVVDYGLLLLPENDDREFEVVLKGDTHEQQ